MNWSLSKRSLVGLVLGAAAASVATAQIDSARQPEASASPAKVGEKAPAFTLKDTAGKEHVLADYTKAGKVVVLEWFNPQCPYVQKHHQNNTTMRDTFARYKDKNVVWIAVNSGREGSDSTGIEYNAEYKSKWKIDYPICLDGDGKVGKAYGARTTPHMYVIDAKGVLVYKGAIDSDSSPNKLGEINYVDEALKAVLAGETVKTPETRQYGCSVKY